MKFTAIFLSLLLSPMSAMAQIAPETRMSDPSHIIEDETYPGDG